MLRSKRMQELAFTELFYSMETQCRIVFISYKNSEKQILPFHFIFMKHKMLREIKILKGFAGKHQVVKSHELNFVTMKPVSFANKRQEHNLSCPSPKDGKNG